MKAILYPMLLLAILIGCTPTKKDERISALEQYLSGQAQYFKFNGNVLVAKNGEVLFKKSFGLADYNANIPLNDSTIFELASVSKQFTAMGILLLEEKGKLSLQDSLRKFFPELPYSGITLHHMLTHISGLPDYMPLFEKTWNKTKIATNADIITLLANEKPAVHFKPAMKWEYSNTAYALLASIIEKVSVQSLQEYLKAEIFDPLGMENTRIYNTRRSGERIPNYAFGYVWSEEDKKHVLPDSLPYFNFVHYLDGIQGDGVVNSTITDLLKWDRALALRKGLPKNAIENLTKKQSLVDTTEQTYYGYGVFHRNDKHGEFITHSGGWPGYTTNLARYLKDDYTIIVLSNNNSPSPPISEALASVLYSDTLVMPYEHKPITLDSTQLAAFNGKYEFRGKKFEFKVERDTLFQIYENGRRFHLIPESTTKVYMDGDRDIQYELRQDEGKRSIHIITFGMVNRVSLRNNETQKEL
jgi:CubicO group peptidase (beta-lactamase class C family)